MNASSVDTRLCGCRTHGGSAPREVALEFHRQAFVRRTLNPGDALRHRVVAMDAFAVQAVRSLTEGLRAVTQNPKSSGLEPSAADANGQES